MNNLSKKLAVITGASSGIGRASALRLAESGYDLVLIARRQSELEILKSEIEALKIYQDQGRPPKVEIRVLDLSKVGAASEAKGSAATHALDGLRHIDVLINCAGCNNFGAITSQTEADWQAMIHLNCLAVVSLSKEGALKMSRGGVIVNVSSLAADIPLPYMAVYSASKAFVTNFSVAFREELRPRGIEVVSLNPGAVRTDFVEKAGMPTAVNREQDRLLVSADYVAKAVVRVIKCPRQVYVPVRSGYLLHVLLYILPRPIKAYLAARTYKQYL
jgi:short-subunit dehydrogenase